VPWPAWLVVVLLAVAAAGFAADRLLLRAEARGWIYYRHRKPSRTAVGNAMMTILQVYEPQQEHTVEESRRYDADEAGDDDPPDTEP
jgi:hypothetical protein